MMAMAGKAPVKSGGRSFIGAGTQATVPSSAAFLGVSREPDWKWSSQHLHRCPHGCWHCGQQLYSYATELKPIFPFKKFFGDTHGIHYTAYT